MTYDPPLQTPWAVQLVVRAPKSDLPTQSAVCEAVTFAVVSLLTDERCAGEWTEHVARWHAGGIRKLVRRASAAEWDMVQGFDGVNAERSGVKVRALVPGPVGEVPRQVRRLQLQGRQLEHGTPAPLEASSLVVAVTPEVPLSWGKAAAAAGHCAHQALSSANELSERWCKAAFPVSVCFPTTSEWAQVLLSAPLVVHDAGLTEVVPETVTAAAFFTGLATPTAEGIPSIAGLALPGRGVPAP